MPPGVTVVRAIGMCWPCRRVWYSDSASFSGPWPRMFGNVEGQPFVQRRLGGVADEGRRHHVAFAVPERDHVAEFAGAHGKVGDGLGMQVADLRANAVECVARLGHGRRLGWHERQGLDPLTRYSGTQLAMRLPDEPAVSHERRPTAEMLSEAPRFSRQKF